MRSAHPVEKLHFFLEIHELDFSIKNVSKPTAFVTALQRTRYTTAAYSSFDAGFAFITAAAAAAAAHSEPAWQIIFSARQHRAPSCRGSGAGYIVPFSQHSWCSARFGESRQSPTPQPR